MRLFHREKGREAEGGGFPVVRRVHFSGFLDFTSVTDWLAGGGRPAAQYCGVRGGG